MERTVGTVVRGVRAPIIREGDDLAQIVTDSIVNCIKAEQITIGEKDVVAVTESILARAQGNYASVDDIAADVRAKFPSGRIGVIFPILSRNRFAICLRGIAKGAKNPARQTPDGIGKPLSKAGLYGCRAFPGSAPGCRPPGISSAPC